MDRDDVSDGLWEEFHRVVNMTSRELSEWMRTQSAGEESETLPDHAGNSLGQRVLGVLGKRRTDLTGDDVAAMTKVVEIVHRERRDDLEPTAGDQHWRRKLMAIGHDPLKPGDSNGG